MRNLLLHCVFLVHHAFTAIYTETIDYTGSSHPYLVNTGYYKWRFATVWNFAIQTTYFSLCVLEDLMALIPSRVMNNLRGKLNTFLSFFFTSLIFPVGCWLAVSFWIIYLYDRELIYPTVVDTKLPAWVNHAIHTVVGLAPLAEMFLVHRPLSDKRKSMAALHSYLGLYSIVSLITYWVRGTWVYPMLDLFTWQQRAMMFVTQHLGTTSVYFVGWAISKAVWGTAERSEPPTKKKKGK